MIQAQLPFGRHAHPQRVVIFVAMLGGVYIAALFIPESAVFRVVFFGIVALIMFMRASLMRVAQGKAAVAFWEAQKRLSFTVTGVLTVIATAVRLIMR